jgi:hypothetical protein
MVAGAVAKRLAVVMIETGEHQQVLAVWRQRLQRLRELKRFAVGRRGPVVHDDAVRHVAERHPDGRRGSGARGVAQCRNHRIEQGQAEGGAETAQQRAAVESFFGDDHRSGLLLI